MLNTLSSSSAIAVAVEWLTKSLQANNMSIPAILVTDEKELADLAQSLGVQVMNSAEYVKKYHPTLQELFESLAQVVQQQQVQIHTMTLC